MSVLKSIAKFFGLHPVVLVLFLGADILLFATDAPTLGISDALIVWPVAVVLWFVTLVFQWKKWGDWFLIALAKAFVVAVVTIIPTSIVSMAIGTPVTVSTGIALLLGYILKENETEAGKA
jgi:hypothetical protein